MTNHDTILQDASHTARQTQHATRAGSHRNRNRGSRSPHRGVPDAVIGVLSSPSHRMEKSVQREMETKLGADFSDVRVHTGSKAAAAAESISARAFTYGKHIVFNLGEYRPETVEGRKLIAHELVHVVQQTGTTGHPEPDTVDEQSASRSSSHTSLPGQPRVLMSSPCGPAEREADRIGELAPERSGLVADGPVKNGDQKKVPSAWKSSLIRGPDRPQYRGSRNYRPACRVGRCVQRQADQAIQSSVVYIPQDSYSAEFGNLPQIGGIEKSFAFTEKRQPYTAADTFAVPKSIKNSVKSNASGEINVITIKKADKKREEKIESLKSERKKLQPHLRVTPWDKDQNLTAEDKWDDIISGKPAGAEFGKARSIPGPAEKHLIAAVRVLYPKYNHNNTANLFTHNIQKNKFTRALKDWGEILEIKDKNGKYEIDVPDKIKGWPTYKSVETSGSNRRRRGQFYVVTKDLWSAETVARLGALANLSDLKTTEVINNHVNRPSETECARLLAAYLAFPTTSKSSKTNLIDYIEESASLVLAPFIHTHLADAVRLVQREGITVGKKDVKKFVTKSNKLYKKAIGREDYAAHNMIKRKLEGKPKQPGAALLDQTLVNMGMEAANAISQMISVAVQFVNEKKNKTWQNVTFEERGISDEFAKISRIASVLLDEYKTILKGVQKAHQKAKIEARKSYNKMIQTVFSLGTTGVSTAATTFVGSAVASGPVGWALLAPAGLAVAVGVAGSGLADAAKVGVDDATGIVSADTLMKEWDENLGSSIGIDVKEILKEQAGKDNVPKDMGPVEDLSSVIASNVRKNMTNI